LIKNQNIGEVIRSLRKSRQLTIDELADLIGVSKVTMYSYENGARKPPTDVLNKIENVLDLKGNPFNTVWYRDYNDDNENPPYNGDNIRKIRMAHNLTISDLAEKSGISAETLQQYEDDIIRADYKGMEKISNAIPLYDMAEIITLYGADEWEAPGEENNYKFSFKYPTAYAPRILKLFDSLSVENRRNALLYLTFLNECQAKNEKNTVNT